MHDLLPLFPRRCSFAKRKTPFQYQHPMNAFKFDVNSMPNTYKYAARILHKKAYQRPKPKSPSHNPSKLNLQQQHISFLPPLHISQPAPFPSYPHHPNPNQSRCHLQHPAPTLPAPRATNLRHQSDGAATIVAQCGAAVHYYVVQRSDCGQV